MAEAVVRCRFYVKVTTEGGWHYDPVHISGPEGDGALYTTHTPAAGDLIWLWDSLAKQGGMYEVVLRQWMHASHGSTNWPYGEPVAQIGPELILVVVLADGAFRDEVERPEEADGA